MLLYVFHNSFENIQIDFRGLRIQTNTLLKFNSLTSSKCSITMASPAVCPTNPNTSACPFYRK